MHLYLHKTHGATVPSTVFKKHFQQLNEKEAAEVGTKNFHGKKAQEAPNKT